MGKSLVIDCSDNKNPKVKIVEHKPSADEIAIDEQTAKDRKKRNCLSECRSAMNSADVRMVQLKVSAGKELTPEENALLQKAASSDERLAEMEAAIDAGKDVRPVRGTIDGEGSW
jgi:hypothetical protein